jgi:hypothetical protein
VVNDAGRPVPGAVVATNVISAMRFVDARTSDAGEFELLIPPSREARFQAFALNMASEQTAPVTVTPEGLNDLTLILHPAGSISGRIIPNRVSPTTFWTFYFATICYYGDMLEGQPSRREVISGSRIFLLEIINSRWISCKRYKPEAA